jgi:multisubunit Na+/H+ antiporter MnhG subunit
VSLATVLNWMAIAFGVIGLVFCTLTIIGLRRDAKRIRATSSSDKGANP